MDHGSFLRPDEKLQPVGVSVDGSVGSRSDQKSRTRSSQVCSTVTLQCGGFPCPWDPGKFTIQ